MVLSKDNIDLGCGCKPRGSYTANQEDVPIENTWCDNDSVSNATSVFGYIEVDCPQKPAKRLRKGKKRAK